MSKLIFLLAIYSEDSHCEIVVSFLSLYHFSGHIESFKDTIVADHYGYDHEIASRGLLQRGKRLKNPLDRHITLLLAIELARPESFLVLVDGDHLVVCDKLIQHLTVKVPALQGLIWLPSARDVTTTFQKFVNKSDPRCVL